MPYNPYNFICLTNPFFHNNNYNTNTNNNFNYNTNNNFNNNNSIYNFNSFQQYNPYIAYYNNLNNTHIPSSIPIPTTISNSNSKP